MEISRPGAMPLQNEMQLSQSDQRAQLRAAAEGFEALFINTLMKTGRATGFGDNLTGSNAVRASQDMFDMQVSQIVSGRSNLGIADALERQFSGHIAKRDQD